MASNEDLLREIVATRTILQEHIDREEPRLLAAEQLYESHGDHEATAARIAFVKEWMRTSEDRAVLRKAIIEKSTIAAVWAVVVFVALAIQHELANVINGWKVK